MPPPPCLPCPGTDGYLCFTSLDVNGNLVSTGTDGVLTIGACATACDAKVACSFFVWQPDLQNTCWLKFNVVKNGTFGTTGTNPSLTTCFKQGASGVAHSIFYYQNSL